MQGIPATLITTLSALAPLAIAEAISEDATWQVLEDCTLQSSNGFDNSCLSIEAGGEIHRFRMYFAEPLANEGDPHERIEDQARYFHLDAPTLTGAGERAGHAAHRFLKGGFEVITKWEDARRKEGTPVFFALLRKNGRYLSAELVGDGLARIHAPPPADTWPAGPDPLAYLRVLKQAERAAQASGSGIWVAATASPQMAGMDLTIAGGAPLHAGPLIDLNTASAAELAGLPGIGPALAERIMRARPFESIDELESVPGISARTVDGLRDRVEVRPPEELNR